MKTRRNELEEEPIQSIDLLGGPVRLSLVLVLDKVRTYPAVVPKSCEEKPLIGVRIEFTPSSDNRSSLVRLTYPLFLSAGYWQSCP